MSKALSFDLHRYPIDAAHLIARATHGLGDHERAMELYHQTLTRCRQLYGDTDAHTIRLMCDMAHTYMEQGDDEQSVIFARQALKQAIALQPADQALVATSTVLMGLVIQGGEAQQEDDVRDLDMQQVGSASYLRDGVGLSEAAFSPGHWRIAVAKHAYGDVMCRNAEFDMAEVLLLDAYAMMNEALGNQHTRTKMIARSLVELYDAWGKTEESQHWQSMGEAEVEIVPAAE